MDGTKERQGDFVFTANMAGEYSFCFSNDMSTVTDKLVDFEISVENEPRAEIPSKGDPASEHTNNVEESIQKLGSQLSTVARTQKYFRTRENRNLSTVKSTESRIVWLSITEALMMVGMGCFQVFVVRQFFTRTKRGYV